MDRLHLTKVAMGMRSLDHLAERQQLRIADGIVPVVTRFRPKQADQLVGGSLYWILRHQLVARQRILGFAEAEDRRCLIRLEPGLVPVRPHPRRAHQGWRYLQPADAPSDYEGGDDLALLPPALFRQLVDLALL